ncbi:GDP-mannose-dependent alpha-mannosyltransferase [Sphingobacterium multivorum]|uniref:GDP-mannose-dependent alpha-mannosyltransferase n=1 Tax=Sphingobacterium multivorum TaxID=28454 RepID=A0A2X2K263_SPHMU|nr:glycosyltransferase [Sphingobacterium multivorum]SPZ94155.1 GDP-mannose-dependent alpha-mannosyltransferase [Sphingobacterium multivorum]
MRKVAFFTEILVEDFDGASRTMFQLINRIDQQKFNYFFIYGGGPTQFRNFHSYKVPTFKIPVNDDYCLAIPQLIKKKLELALDKFAPDMIHIATPSLLGFFALNYAKRKGIPVLTIYHTHFISYIVYYFKNILPLVKPTEQWMKKAMNNFYNKCDIVYVPTKSILNELQQIGLQQEGLKLWQRGIDTALFNPQKRIYLNCRPSQRMTNQQSFLSVVSSGKKILKRLLKSINRYMPKTSTIISLLSVKEQPK